MKYKLNNSEGFILSSIDTSINLLELYDIFQRKPITVWEAEDGQGLLGKNVSVTQNPAWHLTGLDLTPYKRLKFYISPGGSSTTYITPPCIVELCLDSRMTCPSVYNHYIGTAISQYPNNDNRLYAVTIVVSSDKTSVLFSRQISLYGTSATNAADNSDRVLYKIEGYYD